MNTNDVKLKSLKVEHMWQCLTKKMLKRFTSEYEYTYKIKYYPSNRPFVLNQMKAQCSMMQQHTCAKNPKLLRRSSENAM